jgi:transposase-like protein
MHTPSTRTDFLRLRIQGVSLSSIARQLGVSKPTIIAWNRQAQPEIESAILHDQQRSDSDLAASANQDLADLTRKHTAVRQELFSRALRDIPTPALETLAGELRQKIQHLESLKFPTPNGITPPLSPDPTNP